MTDRFPAVKVREDERAVPSDTSPPAAPSLRARLTGVPRPLLIGAGVVLLVVVVAAAVRLRGASPDTGNAPPVTSVAPSAAPAPTVTSVPTTQSPEQDAARRSAFIQTMTRLGLTDTQGNCVADKVATQVGWSKLGVDLMEGENAKLLESLMLSCVKPG